MLTVKNLNQYYGGSHILRDVSLDIPAGQVTVVLGRNGVGKTTLLKCLMGLVPIKTGSIELEGRPIHGTTPYQRARAGIGYVPQTPSVLWDLTVLENLRAFEREYRSRLKSYFTQQLEALSGPGESPVSGDEQQHAPKRLRSILGD